MVAGSDGVSVKQTKNGNTRQACWAVETPQDKPNMVRLRSCYDKFLTASEEPFLLGWTGKKAQQTVQSETNLSVLWEPISEEFYVKLRNPLTGKFLRANTGTPPWKDTVTVDVPERKSTQDWVLWVVDIVDDDAAIEDFDRCSWPRNSMSLPHISRIGVVRNKLTALKKAASAYDCNNSYSMAYNLQRYDSLSSSMVEESDPSTCSASSVGPYKVHVCSFLINYGFI